MTAGGGCRFSRRPSGYALIELLSALATVAVLLLVTGALFRLASRTAREIGDRAEALDAMRTATALLDRELRPLAPGDFDVAPPDSIPLRAFRGTAIPCDSAAGGLRVRYAGIRDPDVSKDSVLAVTAVGEAVVAVTAIAPTAASAACAPAPGETVLALSTAVPLPAAALLLVFERGAYSVGGGALRYRRGMGGRQPLTAAVFGGGATGLRAPSPDAVDIRLDAEAGRPNTFALPARARVPLANPDTVPAP
jgi:type II secretory pathway pseudopilin PulG